MRHFIRNIVFFFLSRWFPRLYVTVIFRLYKGRWIDWRHPCDINEKIQWLKFYGDTSQWPRLADKYAVRDYVKEKGLEDILIPLLGRWERAEDIDWDCLPDRFVMKTNHGSGDVLICTDKASLDKTHYTRYFARLLKEKFGYNFGEPHYNKIRPCVIAEQILDASRQSFPSSSAIDYKIWCFDGKPAYIVIYYNRTQGHCDVNIFDTQWHCYPQYLADNPHYRIGRHNVPPPRCLSRMLAVAATLTEGFPCVRLDLYETGGKIYFGEMTFTPSSGMNDSYTQEFLNILGSLCNTKCPTKSLSNGEAQS